MTERGWKHYAKFIFFGVVITIAVAIAFWLGGASR